jgi:hypothetical protein
MRRVGTDQVQFSASWRGTMSWITGLASASVVLPPSLQVQAILDARRGRLVSVVTDLELPAGPIPLCIHQTTEAHPGEAGLFAKQWHLKSKNGLGRVPW